MAARNDTFPSDTAPASHLSRGTAWARARARYPADGHMPVPLWAVRGLPDGPERTWSALRHELADRSPEANPAVSVYIHIPFCTTRCPFCDCHATLLPRDGGGVLERYLCVLLAEIDAWAALPGIARRPVTTVHFGGGTPLAIGAANLERVVCALRSALGADARTEWAIETTARSLDAGGVAALERLGFTRIHVGVQSLQPDARRILGRHGSPEMVLERIAACAARGWIVSADLLYGLPGQTADHLCADSARLSSAGADGISLYHLNHGPHNHPFMLRNGLAERGEERLFADFALCEQAAASLEALGYRRNHVAHFARGGDGNLYSRHARRGEDLLALGSSADGVFGARFYRHHELGGYLAEASPSAARPVSATAPASGPAPVSRVPPLAGSGTFTPAEEHARTLVAALMTAEVLERALDPEALGFVERAACDHLLAAEESSPGGDGAGERASAGRTWHLTATGAWFAGALTAEAWGLYAPADSAPAVPGPPASL